MKDLTTEKTIYLTSNNTKLKKYGKNLSIYQNDKKVTTIPLNHIRDIICDYKYHLTPSLLKNCATANINIHVISYSGKYFGSLTYDPGKNIYLREAQYSARNNSLEIAKTILIGKFEAQKQTIANFRKGQKLEIPSIEKLKSIEELMGVEGSFAKKYYQYLGSNLKNNDFTFTNRSKRPPKDEVNALLSLGYSFLSKSIHNICNIIGLDPYMGYLHQTYYGRPSLVCDLMEEWRSTIIDKFIWTLFNRKEFTPDHFKKLNDAISYRLTPLGYKKFIEKWNKHIKQEKIESPLFATPVSRLEIIERQIRLFSKFLLGEIPNYKPYALLN